MRVKGRQEHNIVALTVIWLLGVIAFGSMMWTGYLISRAISFEGEIEAAVVALIGQQAGISLLALGSLGAMLSSTSPKPPIPPSNLAGAPVDVNVTNSTSDPVPTEQYVEVPEPAEVADEDEPMPEGGEAAPEGEAVAPPASRAARARRARG